MTWWTPDPHPCLGGCGTILQFPKAKRCPKCNRAHIREKVKVRFRERRERGVCVGCGKAPAFKGGLCEPHWDRSLEYAKKARDKQRKSWKFVNCEICGIQVKKITRTKYCRPCSTKTDGIRHQRTFAQRKEKGLCKQCGRVPAQEDRLCCEGCAAKVIVYERRHYYGRKEKGLCTQCGKKPRGKTTLRCEECTKLEKLVRLRKLMRKRE